jgi:hypothetical protein
MTNIEKLKKLESRIGIDGLQAVIDLVGGDVVRFPASLDHYDKGKRNEQIRRDRLRGADWAALAEQYDLTVDRVRKICAENRNHKM